MKEREREKMEGERDEGEREKGGNRQVWALLF
jgi:hypothetical protein